jgi:hypothetical protein
MSKAKDLSRGMAAKDPAHSSIPRTMTGFLNVFRCMAIKAIAVLKNNCLSKQASRLDRLFEKPPPAGINFQASL